MKIIMISLKADTNDGEGFTAPSECFKREPVVARIDLLDDWIADLKRLRKIASDECYGPLEDEDRTE
jgi:hypothetical protein